MSNFTAKLFAFNDHKIVQAIREGMMSIIPFMILGSVFLIFAFLPISGWDKLIAPYMDALLVPVSVTFDMMALLATISISYSLAKQYDIEILQNVMISVAAFALLQTDPEKGLQIANFGSGGIFTGILAAIFSTLIQVEFFKRNLVIKMPENVPPAVMRNFHVLLAAIFIIFSLWFIRIILNIDVNAIIASLLQPLVFALDSLAGILVYVFVLHLMWTVGIHGASIMAAVGGPILLDFMGDNTRAFIAGEQIPHIVTESFMNAFLYTGASGTLGLAVLMMFSKNDGLKKVGKLSFPGTIFQINEPLVFGAPIAYNPILAIPSVIIPCLYATLTYLATVAGLIAHTVAMIPWTSPPIIGAYLSTAGNVPAAIFSGILIVLGMLIWLPFLKIYERRLNNNTNN